MRFDKRTDAETIQRLHYPPGLVPELRNAKILEELRRLRPGTSLSPAILGATERSGY